jgi:diguanylate cyclase (GGDEF)-like protein
MSCATTLEPALNSFAKTLIWVLLFLATAILLFPAFALAKTWRYEAESPVNVINRHAAVRFCEKCSDKLCVESLGWEAAIEFRGINIPRKGNYAVTLRYRHDENSGRTATVIVNKYPLAVIRLKRPINGFSDYSLILPLKVGENTIGIVNPAAWIADIDYLEVSTDTKNIAPYAGPLSPSRLIFQLADVSDIIWAIVLLFISMMFGCFILAKIDYKNIQEKSYSWSLIWMIVNLTIVNAMYVWDLLDITWLSSLISQCIYQIALIFASLNAIVFALKYTGNSTVEFLEKYSIVKIVSFFYVFIITSDPWLHLYSANQNLNIGYKYLPLVRFGETNFLHALNLSAISVTFFCVGLLFSFYKTVSVLYKKQINVISVAFAIPFFATFVIFPLVNGPIKGLAPANIGAAISLILIGFAFFRYNILYSRPTAWAQGREQHEEAIFVINPQGLLVENNKKASALAPQLSIGQPIDSFLDEEALRQQPELELDGHWYQTSITTIGGGPAPVLGKMIKLWDITEVAQLRNQLRELSIRDGLTGLFNRRYMDEILQSEIENAQANNTDFSLILFDIDDFRKINAKYEYAGGDLVLKSLGEQLLGRDGIACRYGGEEFCIILPNTSLSAAEAWAEAFRKAISQFYFDLNGQRISLTISASSASFQVYGANAMLSHADQALWQAKRNGRNRSQTRAPILPQWGRGLD